MYEIDSNIPKPHRADPRRHVKYPFRIMGVGSSFLVESERARNNAISAANSYRCTPHGQGKKFSSMKVGDGRYRIWRDA
ncbi:MAG TPA: hypothetical protein VJM50_23770 [Pyrinomonadaceae bacterium]|nr:hypothetical protein [Pyrinomonadaceae bacterium]